MNSPKWILRKFSYQWLLLITWKIALHLPDIASTSVYARWIPSIGVRDQFRLGGWGIVPEYFLRHVSPEENPRYTGWGGGGGLVHLLFTVPKNSLWSYIPPPHPLMIPCIETCNYKVQVTVCKHINYYTFDFRWCLGHGTWCLYAPSESATVRPSFFHVNLKLFNIIKSNQRKPAAIYSVNRTSRSHRAVSLV